MPSRSADTPTRRRDARATLMAMEMYDQTLSDLDRATLNTAIDLLEKE